MHVSLREGCWWWSVRLLYRVATKLKFLRILREWFLFVLERELQLLMLQWSCHGDIVAFLGVVTKSR